MPSFGFRFDTLAHGRCSSVCLVCPCPFLRQNPPNPQTLSATSCEARHCFGIATPLPNTCKLWDPFNKGQGSIYGQFDTRNSDREQSVLGMPPLISDQKLQESVPTLSSDIPLKDQQLAGPRPYEPHLTPHALNPKSLHFFGL